MQANPRTIKHVFEGEHRYVVPLFQRPYVWNREDQWEPLWQDLVRLADDELAKRDVHPHFLGALVFEQEKQPTGEVEKRLVIDGQQRLTTLQLVLKAFVDVCRAREFMKLASALAQFTHNQATLSDKAEDELKVWPTNADQDTFTLTMRAGTPEALREHYGNGEVTGHAVADAYLYFAHEIGQWLGTEAAEAEKRAMALHSAISKRLCLVVIDLDEKDDAQVIFETLNARGTPLLPSDLVKNYLFRRAEEEGDSLDALYREYWSHFDTDASYWRREWGRGHTRRPISEWFLMNFLTARTLAEVPLSHVYTGYRAHADRQKSVRAKDLLGALKRYSEIYRRFDERDPDSRADLFFERLQTMGFDSVYPFLLELHERFGNDEAAILPVLLDLESFLVRRLVCDLNTRGYNRLFVDLLKTLEGPKAGLHTRVRDFLLKGTSESNRWPNDAELMDAWLFAPLGDKLNKGRLRMLLEAIESALRSPKTESKDVPKKLTIEHVMPVHWEEHWGQPAPIVDDEKDPVAARNVGVQTLGNLTLLTSKLNPSISNGPWIKKRSAMLEHSLLMLNKDLCKNELWNEEAIQNRGAELFLVSLKIWPHPAGNLKRAK